MEAKNGPTYRPDETKASEFIPYGEWTVGRVLHVAAVDEINFLVRAANSHADLLDALEDLLRLAGDKIPPPRGPLQGPDMDGAEAYDAHLTGECFKRASAAIARARGEAQ